MTIDLTFRPPHYADFDHPVALALNGIKGQMRREMVRDLLSAEGEQRALYDQLLGPIEPDTLEQSLPTDRTHGPSRALGPSWLGGEFLPDLTRQEVEIARIILDSTTMDVFSVRARVTEGGYAYSMFDEYETRFVLSPASSEGTLTLGELIGLIDSAEGIGMRPSEHTFVEKWWWQLLEWGSYSLERCTDFAWVESEQYPQLGAWYEERARQWRIARAAEGSGRAGEEA
jgi:hypothetical protein